MASLRQTFIWTTLLATIGSGGTVAGFLLKDLSDLTRDSALRELDLRASQSASLLESHLEAPLAALTSLSTNSDMALGVVNGLFESEATELLDLYKKGHPLVSHVYMVDKTSMHLIASPRDEQKPGLNLARSIIGAPATLLTPTLVAVSTPEPAVIFITPLLLHVNNIYSGYNLTGYMIAYLPIQRLKATVLEGRMQIDGVTLTLDGQELINQPAQPGAHLIRSQPKMLHLSGAHTAEVHVSAPSGRVFAAMKQRLWATLGSVLAMVLAMLGLVFLLTRSLSKSLVEMRAVIESYADGKFTSELSDQRFAEFKLLKDLLDRMNERTESYRLQSVDLSRQAAIGDMVQMLAHDVRKPFSLLRMGLNMLQAAKTEAQMRSVLAKLTPRVTQAINSVSAMLEDTLAVNQKPQLFREDIALMKLVDDSLLELQPLLMNSQVQIRRQLDYLPLLSVDANKLRRVVSNILDNAVQACQGQGQIWIVSRRAAGGQALELVLGNDGSFIPEEIRARIFESFFTHGKKGGTGLGLAVAKTFMELHDGGIACHSSPERGTEFILTLPVRSESVSPVAAAGAADVQDASEELMLELKALVGSGGPMNILLVDDEAFYLLGLSSLLSDISRACGFSHGELQVHQAESVAVAKQLGDERYFALGIFDFDLGDAVYNGYRLLTELQEKGCVGMAAVHSNRLEGHFKDLGVVLQGKPMGREALLRLLVACGGSAPTPPVKNPPWGS